MKTFGAAKPSRLKALRVSGGFTNRAPSISIRKPRLVLKKAEVFNVPKPSRGPLNWKSQTQQVGGGKAIHHFAHTGGGNGYHLEPVSNPEGGGFAYHVKAHDAGALGPRHVATVHADSDYEAAQLARHVAATHYAGGWQPASPLEPNKFDIRVHNDPNKERQYRQVKQEQASNWKASMAAQMAKVARKIPFGARGAATPNLDDSRAPGAHPQSAPTPVANVSGRDEMEDSRWKSLRLRFHEDYLVMKSLQQFGGNRATEIPSMRLYLDLDPYDNHQGHGHWTGKFDPDKRQEDYEPTEQDMGRPKLTVSQHFHSDDQVEDETIKALTASYAPKLSNAGVRHTVTQSDWSGASVPVHDQFHGSFSTADHKYRVFSTKTGDGGHVKLQVTGSSYGPVVTHTARFASSTPPEEITDEHAIGPAVGQLNEFQHTESNHSDFKSALKHVMGIVHSHAMSANSDYKRSHVEQEQTKLMAKPNPTDKEKGRMVQNDGFMEGGTAYKSFRVSPAERLPRSMKGAEPQALKRLHQKRLPVRSKVNMKVLGRFHRHAATVTRRRRKMPIQKPRIFKRVRINRSPRK